MFFTTTHRAFAAVAIISYMMSAEAFTQEPSIAQNPGSTSPIAPPTKAAPALDPSVEINRTWMWEKGTIFGDSNHSIAISGKTCNPGPNLGAYFIKEGTKLNSNVNSVPFTSNRSFNVAITSEPDGVHSLPQNGGLGEEICYVKIDFRSLRMESNLNQLELKGTCSYEILKYYQRNGKEKPHFKKKEEGVQVLLTAPWVPSRTETPEQDLIANDPESLMERKKQFNARVLAEIKKILDENPGKSLHALYDRAHNIRRLATKKGLLTPEIVAVEHYFGWMQFSWLPRTIGLSLPYGWNLIHETPFIFQPGPRGEFEKEIVMWGMLGADGVVPSGYVIR